MHQALVDAGRPPNASLGAERRRDVIFVMSVAHLRWRRDTEQQFEGVPNARGDSTDRASDRMWRFVEMYGAGNIADHLVATALTANSEILLLSAKPDQAAHELAGAVEEAVARIRGCWHLLECLPGTVSTANLDRWHDWHSSAGDDWTLPATAERLAELVGKDKTRSALMRLAATSEPAASCPTDGSELASRLTALADADSEAWRSVDTLDLGANAQPGLDSLAMDGLLDALLTEVMKRWRKGRKRANRCRRAWQADRSLKSARKLAKHARAFADMGAALSIEGGLPQLGWALARQLREAINLDELREHAGLDVLNGKDALRVRSAIDVGMEQSMQRCMKLCGQVYGQSRDSIELEVRLALDSVCVDRQLELMELPSRQAASETESSEQSREEQR